MFSVKLLSQSLYHGSTVEVTEIDISKGYHGRDFGQGFYLTSSHEQAKRFAEIKSHREGIKAGYVSYYKMINSSDLNVLEFTKPDIKWLQFVLANRRNINQKRLAEYKYYDVIIGPVANDTVGLVLNNLITGVYGDPNSLEAQNNAIRLLLTQKLHDQIVIKNQKTANNLQFIKGESIEIN